MAQFRKGEACSVTVLGLFGPFGDSSLIKAIWNAELKTVHAVEKEYRSYILFGKDCTLAYGLQK